MPFPLFSRFGVELEYMVVDCDSLRVRPIVDRVLQDCARLPGAEADTEEGGDTAFPNDVTLGAIGLSNELVLHVLEMKTAEPSPTLAGLSSRFAESVRAVNGVLAGHHAMLLPTGMHPTMMPDAEMRLWPHDYSAVYKAFNRIFDCRGHGWANLQAAHLNLPFADDATPESEFGRLHAAIRVLLPILPALAASTPIMESRVTGLFDNRLEVYRTNSRKIPAATGRVIPEAVFTRADYERVIFDAIYRAYEPHDPEGLLRHEWANSRGAIARFTRHAIEIRVLDVQECPAADLAILALITSVLRALVRGEAGFASMEELRRAEVEPLHAVLLSCIRDADQAEIGDAAYLRLLGFNAPGGGGMRAGEVWAGLHERTLAKEPENAEFLPAIRVILERGCLARRIVRAVGTNGTPKVLQGVYAMLAKSLQENRLFEP